MPTQLTTNFTKEEFSCPCCGKNNIDLILVNCLQILRNELRKSIIITSGCRCTDHNRSVGGSENSLHLAGKAADFHVPGMPTKTIAELCSLLPKFRNGGIGLYDTHVHVDIRTSGRARWGEKFEDLPFK